MLIGIDASRALRSQRTGTEYYSLNTIRALLDTASGHRFRLYAPDMPGDELVQLLKPAEWRIMPFPRLWTHVRLSWEMLTNPPDALFVPAHVLPLIHRRRGIVTLHDLGYLHFPQAHPWPQRLYLDWSTRWSASVARHIITDSAATRDDLVANYGVPSNRISIAYPGARDLKADSTPACDERVLSGLGVRRDHILAVGTLQPRKNLSVLLQACQGLWQAQLLPPDTQLVLAGRAGWLSDAIVAQATGPDLREHVRITGYLSDGELAALYRSARLLAFPSLYEGFGLPLLEAMQAGVPVICSRTSSLPEVAGDAAIMVAPDDVSGWANAIHQVYDDAALRARLIARGRVQAARFSWHRCANTILQAIEAIRDL